MSEKQKKMLAPEDELQKCREPFASGEAADAAVGGFLSELYALRIKHGLADVFVVVGDFYLDGGQRVGAVTTYMCGDESHEERLAAFGYGRASANRQRAVGLLIDDALKNTMKQPRSRD